MKKDKFASLSELYKRVQPALECKVEEIKRNDITYITKEDIWNYLKINVWSYKNNLTLGEMVDDILNISDEKVDFYVKKEMKHYIRDIKLDENNLL